MNTNPSALEQKTPEHTRSRSIRSNSLSNYNSINRLQIPRARSITQPAPISLNLIHRSTQTSLALGSADYPQALLPSGPFTQVLAFLPARDQIACLQTSRAFYLSVIAAFLDQSGLHLQSMLSSINRNMEAHIAARFIIKMIKTLKQELECIPPQSAESLHPFMNSFFQKVFPSIFNFFLSKNSQHFEPSLFHFIKSAQLAFIHNHLDNLLPLTGSMRNLRSHFSSLNLKNLSLLLINLLPRLTQGSPEFQSTLVGSIFFSSGILPFDFSCPAHRLRFAESMNLMSFRVFFEAEDPSPSITPLVDSCCNYLMSLHASLMRSDYASRVRDLKKYINILLNQAPPFVIESLVANLVKYATSNFLTLSALTNAQNLFRQILRSASPVLKALIAETLVRTLTTNPPIPARLKIAKQLLWGSLFKKSYAFGPIFISNLVNCATSTLSEPDCRDRAEDLIKETLTCCDDTQKDILLHYLVAYASHDSMDPSQLAQGKNLLLRLIPISSPCLRLKSIECLIKSATYRAASPASHANALAILSELLNLALDIQESFTTCLIKHALFPEFTPLYGAAAKRLVLEYMETGTPAMKVLLTKGLADASDGLKHHPDNLHHYCDARGLCQQALQFLDADN